ncbi:MAG: hypothetical protein WAR02_21455 [Pseudolabrys sp.]
MGKITTNLSLVGFLLAFAAGVAAPVSAGASCDSQRSALACDRFDPKPPLVWEFAAQTKRPRVTIYRRGVYPGPNAVRQCRSWLVREYRVSGPVIVPQMRCWWE